MEVGHRGHGKSAILLELQKELDNKKVFTIRVDEFDGIPLTDNSKDFLKLIIEKISVKLAVRMFSDTKLFNNLSKSDKEFLDLIYTYYFRVVSKEEVSQIRNGIMPYKRTNAFKKFLNFFVNLINTSGSFGTFITAGMVREALGQQTFNSEVIVHQKKFISEFEENKPSQEDIKKTEYWNSKGQKSLLCQLSQIVKKIGYSQLVIFVDKLDEYPPVTSNVGRVKDFIKPILNDTSIFINNDIVFSFTIWTQVQTLLEADGIRFDKVDVDRIYWNSTKMIEILNCRLSFFSTKDKVNFEQIVPNKIDRDQIIRLSNGSPRDMLLLLKRIYDEQNEENDFSNSFADNHIRKGIETFINNYNFSAHSIAESQKVKHDVKRDLNLALRIQLLRFDLNAVVSKTGVKNTNQASRLCEKLIDLSIIKELDEYNHGHRQFEVVDPKIEYLIKVGKDKLN